MYFLTLGTLTHPIDPPSLPSPPTKKEMVSLMINYFQKFGSKQCTAMDLKLFLPSLEDMDATQFFQEIYKQIRFDDEMIPTDIDQMQRDVNWHQLHRFSGIFRLNP